MLGLFYVGILVVHIYSERGDLYYKESSKNHDVRVIHHNTTERGFTSRYRPWKLVFKKEYPTKAEAQAAERKVKSMKSRKMIEKMIRGEIEI